MMSILLDYEPGDVARRIPESDPGVYGSICGMHNIHTPFNFVLVPTT